MARFHRATLICFCLLKGSSLFSASATWNFDGSGNWSDGTKWTPAVAPSGADSQASFSTILTMPTATIAVDMPFTIGSIQFDNVNSYTVAGPSALTLSSSSGTSVINVTNLTGTHTVSADLILSSDLSVTQASTGIFTISGQITETGGSKKVTTGGTQVTVLSNLTNSYSGGTTITSGTLRISADGAGMTELGALTGAVTIQSGTFQAGASFATDATRGFTLNGAAVFDTNGNTLTVQGVIGGGGSLTKIGTGILVLTGTNTYSGGTTVNAGTLNVTSNANLGSTSSSLSLGNLSTLQTNGSFTSTRPISLTGQATIDTMGNSIGLSGNITGSSGSLIKAGAGTLTLTGNNTYGGTTTINAGTLVVNTSSLPGNVVQNGTLLRFNQTTNGTYAGVISGTGPMTIQGGANLTMTGNSSGFTGTTTVAAGQLTMNGDLSGSAVTINGGATLSGTGTVGSFDNSGTIIPGSGLGTLNVSGNGTFQAGSVLSLDIAPLSNGLLNLGGTAFLSGNGTLFVTPTAGFYGLTATYTLLNAALVNGQFAANLVTDSNFVGTFSYPGNSVELFVRVLRPFADFPFANNNERAVGNNIDELNASGAINPDMASVIDALAGQSNATINSALDQMHPAAFSAFAEMQGEVGGQLLSIFHRKPFLICGCDRKNRIWAEPFGNWLREKERGEEIGFQTTARGIAFGYDVELFDSWTVGVGAAWNANDLSWDLDRGHAYTEGFYGAFYTDFVMDNFYLGGTVYGGKDWFSTARHIHFTTIDRKAEAHFGAVDVAGQFTAAYFFGTPSCLLYPYGTVDYLYLNTGAFSENGADSLNLSVESYKSQTLRSEAGIAFQVIDKNYKETFCISPLVGLGWAMEWPLERSNFTSRFEGQTVPFEVKGWDLTWQLLNVRFGLGLVYRCFTLDSQYIADISPRGGGPFLNQRANFRLSYNF